MYASKENAPIATIVATIPRGLAHPGGLMLLPIKRASYAVRGKGINVSSVGLVGQVKTYNLLKSKEKRSEGIIVTYGKDSD